MKPLDKEQAEYILGKMSQYVFMTKKKDEVERSITRDDMQRILNSMVNAVLEEGLKVEGTDNLVGRYSIGIKLHPNQDRYAQFSVITVKNADSKCQVGLSLLELKQHIDHCQRVLKALEQE